MSDQEPASQQRPEGQTPPPVPPGPVFSPYEAPAYGDVAPEPPAAPLTSHPASHPASYPAPQYLAHPGAPAHPLAVTALVLGILGLAGLVLAPLLGLTFVLVVCSPVAIVLGARAKRQIRQQPGYGGETMAATGFWLGIAGTVLGAIGVLLLLAFIAFIASLFAAA
ncbi:DUF4190 domain-containing protein [Nocardioides sp. zg-536]|uniref:DUF4190 domain-containing protein n=1 Tax=Nocardioides faecalis TaxID=2803858 RepID=A0A938YA83_9ACTN|nr:DUF4190 domain-containing protein [Nocardioides faecalis]MBM9460958.1 DUF4190 domain-containing protein [Nocardioides faecalis]QVI59219.1 DUF4190 domain-containing protein [Nocardioides faecalis]